MQSGDIFTRVAKTHGCRLENLAYADAIEKPGFIGGVRAAGYEEPRRNLAAYALG